MVFHGLPLTAAVRRGLALTLLAGCLVMSGAAASSGAVGDPVATTDTRTSADAGASRPNVLLIKTDDQVWDTPQRLQKYMPNVMSFFTDNGVSYDNSFVSSPSCCQSRASTVVGRYPHNTGVRGQGQASNLDARGGIAAYLQGAGYRTALFGKYLNLVPVPPYFDESTTVVGSCSGDLITEDCGSASGDPAWYYNFTATTQDGTSQVVPGDPATGLNYNTTWIGARASDFLDRAISDRADNGRPFFLEFDPTAPHMHDRNPNKNMVEPRYRKAVVPGCAKPPTETDRTDKPSFVQAFPQSNAAYGYLRVCPVAQRTLKSVDDWFGRTITALRTSGQLDDTLVIFTSDNGLMYGEHALQRKYVAYDPSVRVPLMIAYPGVFAPRTEAARTARSALVSNIDLLPTILDVVGLERDRSLPSIDGTSLVTSPEGHDVIFSEYFRDPGYSPSRPAPIPTWASSFDGRYRFIVTYAGKDKAATQELYDLQSDPGELTNLIPVTAGKTSPDHDVSALRQALDRMRACGGSEVDATGSCP